MTGPHDSSRRWAEIDALFAAVMDLPPEARDAYLGGIADEELRREVRSLVAHQAPDGTVFEAAIAQVAGHWVAAAEIAVAGAAPVPGRRFGPYEVTGIVGQGGMGAVYRARRADGQFEQDVAIKLPERRSPSRPAARISGTRFSCCSRRTDRWFWAATTTSCTSLGSTGWRRRREHIDCRSPRSRPSTPASFW